MTDGTGFAPTMTAAEALMWRVSNDPWLDPSGSLITVLDRPADLDLLRTKLSAALLSLPRLAERVIESSNPLAPPRWAPDPDFDINRHLVAVELPDPGDHQALLDFAIDAHQTAFAPDHPPWRMYAVSGLAGGRGALVARLHHSVADGIGAMRMAEAYLDFEQAAAPPEPVDLDSLLAGQVAAAGPDNDDGIADFIADALRVPLALTRSTLAEFALIGSDPGRARESSEHALELVRGLLAEISGDPTTDSASDEWQGRSGNRELATIRLSLSAARTAGKARGASINDVFVATMAEAAVLAHDEAPPQVAMSYVRSTRTGDGAGGNAFIPNRITAPGPPADIEERFRELYKAMRPVDSDGPPIGLDELGDVAVLLPDRAISRIGREQGRRIDIVTSNLHGSPIPLFVAGAAVEAMYPIGPIAGAACNATLMSYGDSLDVGIITDPAAIEDGRRLANAVQEAFDRVTA